jgi:hypothetical protein
MTDEALPAPTAPDFTLWSEDVLREYAAALHADLADEPAEPGEYRTAFIQSRLDGIAEELAGRAKVNVGIDTSGAAEQLERLRHYPGCEWICGTQPDQR